MSQYSQGNNTPYKQLESWDELKHLITSNPTAYSIAHTTPGPEAQALIKAILDGNDQFMKTSSLMSPTPPSTLANQMTVPEMLNLMNQQHIAVHSKPQTRCRKGHILSKCDCAKNEFLTRHVHLAVKTDKFMEEKCLFCWGPYDDEHRAVRVDHCDHVFGERCLEHLIASTNLCPKCRTPWFMMDRRQMRQWPSWQSSFGDAAEADGNGDDNGYDGDVYDGEYDGDGYDGDGYDGDGYDGYGYDGDADCDEGGINV